MTTAFEAITSIYARTSWKSEFLLYCWLQQSRFNRDRLFWFNDDNWLLSRITPITYDTWIYFSLLLILFSSPSSWFFLGGGGGGKEGKKHRMKLDSLYLVKICSLTVNQSAQPHRALSTRFSIGRSLRPLAPSSLKWFNPPETESSYKDLLSSYINVLAPGLIIT